MSKVSRFLTAIFGLLAIQCGPDRVAGGAGAGNPPLADVALTFKAGSAAAPAAPLAKSAVLLIRNPDGTFTLQDSGGASLVLTAIQVNVEKIDFDLPEGLTCKQAKGVACDSDEVEVEGAFAMELITGKSDPPIGKIRLPEGVYKKVGLSLEAVDADSVHSGASGDSGKAESPNLVIAGHTDSSSGPVRSFSMRLTLREGLDFENAAGLRIKADSLNGILLALSVDHWFDGVELSKCVESAVPDSAGLRILGGDSFCGGAGARIRRNIEASTEFEDDHEGEGPD